MLYLLLCLLCLQTLVIAYFNFTKYQEEEAPGFNSFHRAALLALEKDPIQYVQFGVITNPALAESINLHKPKTIVLLRTLKEPLVSYFGEM